MGPCSQKLDELYPCKVKPVTRHTPKIRTPGSYPVFEVDLQVVLGWGGTATNCTLNSYPFDCNIYFNFLLIKHILKHLIYKH